MGREGGVASVSVRVTGNGCPVGSKAPALGVNVVVRCAD